MGRSAAKHETYQSTSESLFFLLVRTDDTGHDDHDDDDCDDGGDGCQSEPASERRKRHGVAGEDQMNANRTEAILRGGYDGKMVQEAWRESTFARISLLPPPCAHAHATRRVVLKGDVRARRRRRLLPRPSARHTNNDTRRSPIVASPPASLADSTRVATVFVKLSLRTPRMRALSGLYNQEKCSNLFRVTINALSASPSHHPRPSSSYPRRIGRRAAAPSTSPLRRDCLKASGGCKRTDMAQFLADLPCSNPEHFAHLPEKELKALESSKVPKIAYHVPRRDNERIITSDKKPYILRFLEKQWAIRTKEEKETLDNTPMTRKKRKLEVAKKRTCGDVPSSSAGPKTRRLC
uniref:DDA1 domain-containing protein n=1 Tax=Angiostrongylus cantonensis TaxID=6313 RepID=A0A0K0D0T6_ANGCA